jgi:ABC-2 type transport system permease protein
MINFGTYPDGIFEGIAKGLFYTLIPVGFVVFVPVRTITNFNIYSFLIIILVTIFLVTLAFIIFNKGLKKYSSSNLMSARI